MQLTTWEGFVSAVQSVRDRYGSYLDPCSNRETPNSILFRGQPDARYSLSTTLERRIDQRAGAPFHVWQYMECATRHQNEIESYTGSRWNVPSNMREAVAAGQHGSSINLPAFEYLVYLRHHGFPSPLLDWTSSPYIAAYFAYIDSNDQADPSVFCFIDRTDGSKGYTVGTPVITQHGPYVTTDKRHFAQEAQYTTCTRREGNGRGARDYFCSHEEAFARNDRTQDVLIKIVLPANARRTALRALTNDYKINHFALFQTEDSLVATIASRVFEIE